MSNDNGLVDEFENLEKEKKEIELKEEELKKKIIELAKQKNTDILFGTHKKCSIKEYEKIIYPEDKTGIINLLKQKGLWNEFAMINYSRFGSKAVKGELDKEIVNLIKKEKAFRVSMRDI
ncbi:MAG: hypothetical protein KKF67_00740 [Nanoarchaeota archaeon]|nr:hypothetical protein [Nanoarchaeota archaeon]